jgi:sterol desaturase/sphingolipid hydroxylase (fatty acid hydroxylase superfamily)
VRCASRWEVPSKLAIRFAIGAATLIALTLLERRFPLRRQRHRANRRLVVNLAVGAIAFAGVTLVYGVVVLAAVHGADERGLGLVRWLALPRWVAVPLIVVLLDYTLWIWHWLNHRVVMLWRFHAAHHADLDLDASSALRFHPGELLLSLPFRACQVVLIGATLWPLFIWEGLLFVFTQFHHSNLRLPERADRVLSQLVITPRLHGIHHSRRPAELHANFGTLLSIWDRLHRARVTDVAQDTIDIGLPHQGDPSALGVTASLMVPFHRSAPPRE